METLAMYLGIGIANIVNALNPGVVLIGGQMAKLADELGPRLERVLARRALAGNRSTPIDFVAADAVADGAAGLALWQTVFADTARWPTERLETTNEKGEGKLGEPISSGRVDRQ
ncbi:ROK family protein [Alicyclobacillus herbarius]|uniref:ROK family protein n=1 Tax=Alicyclobacillus herbarius TaxID=122960 RepID=UPI002355A707|nr:ROK family protein [Alicyclobacillus herbarius]